MGRRGGESGYNGGMNRRTFLLSLGVAGAGAVVSRTSIAADVPVAGNGASSEGSLFALRPYAQLVGPGMLEIRWRTARPATGWVRWTQDPALPPERWAVARWVEDGMVAANTVAHRVRVPWPDEGKALRFEAVSEAVERFGAYDIRLAAPEGAGACTLKPQRGAGGEVSLAMLNDVHGRTGLIPKALALPAAREVAFALFNGDCLDDCANQVGAEKRFLSTLPKVCEAGFPVLFLRGNHEYRGAMARRLRENLAPLACGRFYGAFTLGPVRVVCLDSGEDKPDDVKVYGGLIAADPYLEEQAAWLRGEVASPAWQEAKWRVVVSHIPPVSEHPKEDAWHGPTRLRTLVSPILRDARVTVWLCGHTHRRFTRKPDAGHPYPIVIGGGPSEQACTAVVLRADAQHLTVATHTLDGQAHDALTF